MGYEPNFPVNQLGGQNFLWVIIEYGLLGIWVRRESTVISLRESGDIKNLPAVLVLR